MKLWGLLLQRLCAWHAPGLFEYEILRRPAFLIWLVVCCWLFINHAPTYATVCNAGLLLSSQRTNQEPTVRSVGLPELEMQIKIDQPLRRKSAIATTEKQQKETPILRWKNGPLFWVPYWKRNSNIENGPQNGARFLDPKTGSAFWWNCEGFCCSVFAPDTRLVCLNMKFFAGLHFWYGSWFVAWLFINHAPTYATVCNAGCC